MALAMRWCYPGTMRIYTDFRVLFPCVLSACAFSVLMATSQPLRAQNIVDPDKVAPEFRAAAEKRRAEQLKLYACNRAAQKAGTPPREMAKTVAECFDKPDEPAPGKDKPK